MANEQNLRPFTSDQSHEEAVKNGRKGGKASAKSRADKRNLRVALEMLLETEYPKKDKDGNIVGKVTGTEAITAKLFDQAMKGNIKAFETLRDTVGQKPVEQVTISAPNTETIERVENALFGGDKP